MPGQIARTIANKKPDRKVSNAPTNQNGEAKSLKFAPSYDCRGQRKASRAAYRLRERERGGRGEGGEGETPSFVPYRHRQTRRRRRRAREGDMARGNGRTRVIPFLSLLSLLNKGRYEEWGRRENDRDRARQTEIDKETN